MKLTRKEKLERRHLRVRKKVNGTAERPRLSVRKTLKHLYAQVVDDSPSGGARTIAIYATASRANAGKHMSNVSNGADLGKSIGADLKSRGIDKIVFDRGGYRYHGCVKAIADAIRETGIQF